MAGAVADAMAAPVEGRRAARTAGRDRRPARARAGSGMPMAPGTVGSPGRQRRKISGGPRPATTGSAVAKPSACQRAARSASVSGSSRIGGKAETTRGPPEPRQARPSCDEPRGQKARASRGGASALRRASACAAEDRLRIGGGRASKRSRRIRRSRIEARSREGRWTVIPGAYVSRWAPCAQAHGRGQGQLP